MSFDVTSNMYRMSSHARINRARQVLVMVCTVSGRSSVEFQHWQPYCRKVFRLLLAAPGAPVSARSPNRRLFCAQVTIFFAAFTIVLAQVTMFCAQGMCPFIDLASRNALLNCINTSSRASLHRLYCLFQRQLQPPQTHAFLSR